MPFSATSKKSGRVYYLHSRQQQLKGGHIQTLYFFAPDIRDGALEQIPNGHKIVEIEKTGMLVLTKKAAAAAAAHAATASAHS